jgi:hypothetical protein
MRVGLMTREYPPHVYGGAGVHVEYLSRELAKLIEVEVHCWGKQRADDGTLHVIGDEPPVEVTAGSEAKFKTAVDALALNLTQMKELSRIDVVHTQLMDGAYRDPGRRRDHCSVERHKGGHPARVSGGGCGEGARHL